MGLPLPDFQAPLVYDYWLRKADDTIASMITYLGSTAAQNLGIMALAGISGPYQTLMNQLDKAQEAIRIVILVYLGHCALYALLLAPVAYKLIKLLDSQIASLVRKSSRMGEKS